MCTLLLRFAPGAPWPILAGAVRDEFADRAWDAPAPHWDGSWAGLVGGRDRTAGGTWLAVDPAPARPALAALLNGERRPPLPDGAVRPTRGDLALRVLRGEEPHREAVVDHDGFHLVRATLDQVEMWSWDGETLTHAAVEPGDHIVVNLGLDTAADPLVPHFSPLLAAAASPDPAPGLEPDAAWGAWLALLAGDALEPTDPRALVVRREIEGRTYASTSAALLALGREGIRYDFTADPRDPVSWYEVALD